MPTKSDEDRQDEYQKAKDKETAAYEKDPKKAEEAGRKDAFDRLKEGYKAVGLTEDINSMVHPDDDDPVEARGSGKEGVPAGSEDYAKATKKLKVDDDGQVKAVGAHKDVPSDHSTNPKDKNAPVTVDPVDGKARTKDGVK